MSHRSITDVVVHVVWSTLERRPILDASHDAILAWVLAEKARAMGSRLLGCGFASDHAHVAVTLDPKVRLADLIQRLKGASAYELSRSDTWPTPLRWQAGYWAESISPSSVGRLLEYVSAQRTKHEDVGLAERWMAVRGER